MFFVNRSSVVGRRSAKRAKQNEIDKTRGVSQRVGGQTERRIKSGGIAARRNCNGGAAKRKAATEPAEWLHGAKCGAAAMEPRKYASALFRPRSGGKKNSALAYLIHLLFSLV